MFEPQIIVGFPAAIWILPKVDPDNLVHASLGIVYQLKMPFANADPLLLNGYTTSPEDGSM